MAQDHRQLNIPGSATDRAASNAPPGPEPAIMPALLEDQEDLEGQEMPRWHRRDLFRSHYHLVRDYLDALGDPADPKLRHKRAWGAAIVACAAIDGEHAVELLVDSGVMSERTVERRRRDLRAAVIRASGGDLTRFELPTPRPIPRGR